MIPTIVFYLYLQVCEPRMRGDDPIIVDESLLAEL